MTSSFGRRRSHPSRCPSSSSGRRSCVPRRGRGEVRVERPPTRGRDVGEWSAARAPPGGVVIDWGTICHLGYAFFILFIHVARKASRIESCMKGRHDEKFLRHTTFYFFLLFVPCIFLMYVSIWSILFSSFMFFLLFISSFHLYIFLSFSFSNSLYI